MAITFSKYRDINSVKLSFNNYEATILYGRGCNLIEFNDKARQLTVLHAPADEDLPDFQKSPQRYGSAPLFPPNKIHRGRYTRDGKEYDLVAQGIPFAHGLLKEFSYSVREWVETPSYSYIKFSFNSLNSVYYNAFHWNFDCFFEFRLSDEGVSQTISFFNHGMEPIPFGVGFHTSFQIPFDSSSTPKDYLVYAGTGMQWELDDHSCPTGQLSKPARDYIKSGINPLESPIAEHLQVSDWNHKSLEIEHFHGAVILDTRTNTKVLYEIDSKFSQWMFWNNNAAHGYICLEPMTCIINAPNVTQLPDKLTGFQYLASNQYWSATNNISISI